MKIIAYIHLYKTNNVITILSMVLLFPCPDGTLEESRLKFDLQQLFPQLLSCVPCYISSPICAICNNCYSQCTWQQYRWATFDSLLQRGSQGPKQTKTTLQSLCICLPSPHPSLSASLGMLLALNVIRLFRSVDAFHCSFPWLHIAQLV